MAGVRSILDRVNFLSTYRRRFLATGLLLCMGVASVLFMKQRGGDSIEWLAKSPMQPSKRAFLGPWAQPVRIQLSRLKQWMFGPRSTIAINAMIFELSPTTLLELAAGAKVFTNKAGARAFLVENRDQFRSKLLTPLSIGVTNKLLSSPSMITADGMQAQMASYETVSIGASTNVHKANAGWWIDVWPRANGNSTDLACFLTHTERAFERVSPSGAEVTNSSFIRTNAFLGARVRIPENGSLFLLSPAANANGHALGILLSPTVQKPPGR